MKMIISCKMTIQYIKPWLWLIKVSDVDCGRLVLLYVYLLYAPGNRNFIRFFRFENWRTIIFSRKLTGKTQQQQKKERKLQVYS